MDGGPAKSTHPQQTEQRRQEEDAQQELADGSAPGNAGKENPDERCPGQPPGQVEGRPVVQEGRVLSAHPVAERHDGGQVAAQPAEKAGPDIEGRSEADNAHQQPDRQQRVQLAETLDAAIDAGQHRAGGHRGNQHDEHHPGQVGGRNPEQVVETSRYLIGSQAERGGKTEHGGEDGQRINQVAGPAPDALTEQGIEGRANRERQAPVIAEEGQGEPHHRVNGPTVQTPVKRRRSDAQGASRLGVGGIKTERGIQKVLDRLQHAEEHQPDAGAGGKEHGAPTDKGILGNGCPPAEPHLAERGDDEKQAEQHDEVGAQQEQPVELGGEPGPGIAKDSGRPLRE